MAGRVNGGGGKVANLISKFENQTPTNPASKPAPPVPTTPKPQLTTSQNPQLQAGTKPPVPTKPSRLSEDLAPKKTANDQDGFSTPPKKNSGPATPTPQASTATPTPQTSTPGSNPLLAESGWQPVAKPQKNSAGQNIVATQLYNPPKVDLPGNKTYTDIVPMQGSVSQSIVQSKIDGWAKNPPAQPPKVPVYETHKIPNDPSSGTKLSLAGDGHHTFVAAMKTGQPIELQMVRMPGGVKTPNSRNDWQDFKYDNFNKGDSWKA
ncbi:hypothetical protein ACN28S_18365 [Cystobacter fuscus]